MNYNSELQSNNLDLQAILDAVNELPEIDKSKQLITTVTGDGFVHLDDISEVPHDITIQAAAGTKVTVSAGNNIWNEQWTIGAYNDNTGAFNPNGTRFCISPDNPIYVKGNTYYSFSNSGKAYFNIFWFDNNGTFLRFDYVTKYKFSLCSPSNASKLCFYMGAAYGQTYLKDIQIEAGVTCTPYEPYSATEITTPTIKSTSPNMTFSILPENTPISITYNKSWGMNEEYNRFWNGVFSGGNWQSKFVGSTWNDKTFRPNQDIKPTGSANNLFDLCEITDLCKILNDCGVVLDTSGITARSDNMFNYAIYLTTVPYLDLRNANYSASGIMRNLFSNCYELKSIEGIHLAEDGAQVLGLYAFNQCKKLEEVRFYGTIGSNGIDFQHSTKLSRASIESVINALSSTTSGLSVTFSKTAVNSAFTTAEWNALAATKSNWTISLV